MAPVSEYAPTCDRIPGTIPHGPGWYLVAANRRVEAGPFASRLAALAAARWMDDHGRGVNPAPWQPVQSRTRLMVGARYRRPRLDSPPG